MKTTTVLALLATLLAAATTGCKPYPPPVGDTFVDQDVWGPKIVRISECWRGKHDKHVCRIETADGKAVYRDLRNWPGRWMNVHEQLGTRYRVGEEVVEKWRIRTRSNNMSWIGWCYKKDPECTWPSKARDQRTPAQVAAHLQANMPP
jgi:hypothetical protein